LRSFPPPLRAPSFLSPKKVLCQKPSLFFFSTKRKNFSFFFQSPFFPPSNRWPAFSFPLKNLSSFETFPRASRGNFPPGRSPPLSSYPLFFGGLYLPPGWTFFFFPSPHGGSIFCSFFFSSIFHHPPDGFRPGRIFCSSILFFFPPRAIPLSL